MTKIIIFVNLKNGIKKTYHVGHVKKWRKFLLLVKKKIAQILIVGQERRWPKFLLWSSKKNGQRYDGWPSWRDPPKNSQIQVNQ